MARKGFKDAQSRFGASKRQIQRYHLQRLRRTILSDDILHKGALVRDRIDFPMQKITQTVQNDGVIENLDRLQDFGIMPYDDAARRSLMASAICLSSASISEEN